MHRCDVNAWEKREKKRTRKTHTVLVISADHVGSAEADATNAVLLIATELTNKRKDVIILRCVVLDHRISVFLVSPVVVGRLRAQHHQRV